MSRDYCSSEIKPGEICALRLVLSPTELGAERTAFHLAYTSPTNQDVRSMMFLAGGLQPPPTEAR